MKHTIILLVILVLMGCATTIPEEEIEAYKEFCEKNTTVVVETERTVVIEACVQERINDELEYNREVKEIERLEQWYMDEAACESSGGMMQIDRYMSGGRFNKNRPPRRDERYGCMGSGDYQRMMRNLGMM